MRNAFINTVLVGVVAFLAIPAFAYVAGTPVPTDSRIKTLVYNANDVYRVLTHYGYQMNIEFGKDEEIETISVGDRVGWQITPAEDRLFIRAMDDKSHTNMTVITNEHTYQFDLYSSKPGENGWDELVYVVRFFYPPEGNSQFASAKPATPMMASFSPPPAFSMSAPAPVMMAPPAMQMQQAPQMPPMSMMAPQMQASPMMAPQIPQMPVLPPMQMQQAPSMMAPQIPPMSMMSPSPMGRPLYSPALPPVSPPPMASPQIMARPATPVPPVNVARKPFGMIAPPNMAVAPPPRMPHPRSPFIVNQMGQDAQSLARKYPQGSYRNPLLAPRRLPSLNGAIESGAKSSYSANVNPMTLPLPSSVPGGYMQF